MSDTLGAMLEYNTLKIVRVRSKLLGSLHWLFMIGIALYIGGYVFYKQKHYLAFESPAGLQRLTVQDPCDPLDAADECTFPPFSGKPAFGQKCLPPKAFRCPRHEYCKYPDTPAEQIHSGVGGKLKCRYWDHNTMVWPPAERGALTIASRASLIQQELLDVRELQKGNKKICDSQTEMQCQWSPALADHASYGADDAYMGDLGNFTVRISHSMWAPSFPISANSADMEGWLLKCNPGANCAEETSWTPIKHLPRTGSADELYMRDIFYAATPPDETGVHGPGLDMDQQSDACPRKCNNTLSTYRYMGVVLHATIIYDNTGTIIEGSSDKKIMYHVKIFTKPSTLFHVQVVHRGSTDKSRRTINHLYGPRVVFDVGGKVGSFQFNNVVVQLTTSLAMFAVATTLVDLLMLYALPKRDEYNRMKYVEESDDIASTKSSNMQYSGGESGAVLITSDPQFPPGMTPPPGMQRKNEEQPLLSAPR